MADKILKSLNFGTEDDYYFAQSADKINGVISVENGGFGATTADEARQNIGAASEIFLGNLSTKLKCLDLITTDDGEGNLTIGLVNLLSGYTPLAYIESTGTQYIDLGITPSDDMEFEIEYQVTSGSGKLYGAEISNNIFDAINVTPTSGRLRAFKHSGGETLTDITTVANEKVALKVVVKDSTYSTYINGEIVDTKPAVGTPPDDTMYLFACHRYGVADTKIKAIVWSCRVKKSGKFVGDFKPYLNDNGEAGLLNTVDMKFHKNLGTGVFAYEYSIDSYVHDSVNLFLDGIWNEGEGVHNETLTSWVDLSGNCQPTHLNTGNTVGENCIKSDGTSNGKMVVPDVDPINLTTFTLELIYKKGSNTTSNQVILGRDYKTSYYVNISNNNLTFWGGNKTTVVARGLNYAGAHILQLTHTGNSATAWVDGVKTVENFTTGVRSTSDNLVLFIHKGNSSPMNGSIMAVRIHNRILTDKELAQNLEIDKARFGLLEPARPEYIEFTGKQYVKLDLPFTKDTVCRIKFNMIKPTGSCIMGSSPAFRFFNAQGSTYLDWGRSAYGGRINGGSTPAGKTFFREFGNNYVKDLDTGEIIVSGVMYRDTVKYDNNPICIMGNPYQECAIGIVYLAEVIQNGKTVRSLLPHISSAGELGFRDAITGKFYGIIDTAKPSAMSLRMADTEVTEDYTIYEYDYSIDEDADLSEN